VAVRARIWAVGEEPSDGGEGDEKPGAIPTGLQSSSPRLRGTSYLGSTTKNNPSTLKAEIFKLKIIGHLPAVPIGATHLKRKSSLKL
jgi:hypothetical protein